MVGARPEHAMRHALRLRLAVLLATGMLGLGCGEVHARGVTRATPAARAGASLGHAMVAAANPLAVRAGVRVLRAGGSAVDAAVAVQAVLGLVEPQSSGLGGGAFMMFREGRSGRLTVYDGRETAPGSAIPALFLGEDGKPLPFFTALLSGRSTGAPGAVAMLALAQKEHGRRPWRELFTDAAQLAQDGFVISPRLGRYIAGDIPMGHTADANGYFTRADGERRRTGDLLRNPAYAATVRRLAAEGPSALYTGDIAAHIVAKLREGERPGGLTLADLAAYVPVKREALCRPHLSYVICAPPSPASGAGLQETLGLLERTDIGRRGPADPQSWVIFSQASRLMYADRDRYIGDPAFAPSPVAGLLARSYLDDRARLIPTVAAAAPAAGVPDGAAPRGADATREPGGTTHFVIVDRWGDVVSMTTTVESVFGSGRMVDGFFLNNQLTDFSFSPTTPDGAPAANAVAAGKRPRSSMVPSIVLDRKGRFVMAIGSPGGNSIVAYVAKALVGVLDWKLPLQEAIDLPNLVARGASVSMEQGRFDAATVAALRATGALVATDRGEDSGLHAIRMRTDGTLEGAADRRREGVVEGW